MIKQMKCSKQVPFPPQEKENEKKKTQTRNLLLDPTKIIKKILTIPIPRPQLWRRRCCHHLTASGTLSRPPIFRCHSHHHGFVDYSSPRALPPHLVLRHWGRCRQIAAVGRGRIHPDMRIPQRGGRRARARVPSGVCIHPHICAERLKLV